MATQTAARRTTLSLSTLHDDQAITIDGVACVIKHPDTLALGHLRKFERLAPRINDLIAIEDPSAKESEELSAALQAITDVVLVAPPEIHRRLKDLSRVQVVEVFTTLRAQKMTRPRGVMPPASRRKTAKSSRG